MMLDDDILMAYADGESEHAAEVAAALNARPHLARRVAELRALRDEVSDAFAPIAAEPPPAHLAALVATHTKPVPAPAPKLVLALAGAMAAAAAIGFVWINRPQQQLAAPGGAPPITAGGAPFDAKPEQPVAAPQLKTILIVPSAAPGTQTISSSIWLKWPDGRDFQRFYPPAAVAQNQSGRVVLDCTVDAIGNIDCTIAEERPAGWGFGEAALKMSKLFQMSLTTVDGQPTAGGRINVPITFKLAP